MAEDQLLAINVWLAGRSYRIRIRPEEEEAVRKAVKVADAKIMEMRNNYAGKDDQDFVAMCLLMYAADNAIETFHSPIVKEEVSALIARIDQVLGEQ